MNRLPVCVGLTHKQIWAQYKDLYPEVGPGELRRIHLHWVNAYAAVAPGKYKGKSTK